MAIKRVSDLPELENLVDNSSLSALSSSVGNLSNVVLEVSNREDSNQMFSSYQTNVQDTSMELFKIILQAAMQGMYLSNFVMTNRNSGSNSPDTPDDDEQNIVGNKTFDGKTAFNGFTEFNDIANFTSSIVMSKDLTSSNDYGTSLRFQNNAQFTFQRQNEEIAKGAIRYVAYSADQMTGNYVTGNKDLSNSTLATTHAIIDYVSAYVDQHGSGGNIDITTLSDSIANKNETSALAGKAVYDYLCANPMGFINIPGAELSDITTLQETLESLVSEKSSHYYVNGLTGDDNNNGLSASTAFRTLQRAITAINKRKFIGNAEAFIYIMGDITIDNSSAEYSSLQYLMRIYHPDLVQTRQLHISGKALNGVEDSTGGKNLKKCFRKINIDIMKVRASNSAIEVYSNTRFDNIIFDGMIDDDLFDIPPTLHNGNVYTYSKVKLEDSISSVSQVWNINNAYNLSNETGNYISNNYSLNSNTNYPTIPANILIQGKGEGLTIIECVFKSCSTALYTPVLNLQSSSVNGSKYERRTSLPNISLTYIANNTFYHCTYPIIASGNNCNIYGRVIIDKCYDGIQSTNIGRASISDGTTLGGKMTFNTVEQPFKVLNGSLFDLGVTTKYPLKSENQITSYNELTSDFNDQNFFTVISSNVFIDQNTSNLSVSSIRRNYDANNIPGYLSSIAISYKTPLTRSTGYTDGGYVNFNISNYPLSTCNKFITITNNEIPDFYTLPESGDEQVV